MQQLVQQLQTNTIEHASVALTFDDGYLDNYTTAKPLLEKRHLPATFFITNTLGNTDKEFWWDALEYILLENESLPTEITLTINNTPFTWNLEEPWQNIISEEAISWVASWLPWATPPSPKHALFLHLSEAMKALPQQEKDNVIQQLFAIAGKENNVRGSYKVMYAEQLAALSANPLFEVGAHSAHHAALAKFDKAIQESEVVTNKTFLENQLDKKISGYGYAHGSYNTESIDVLKQYYFAYACSTEHAAVTTSSNAYALPRLHVKNWNAQIFKQHIEMLLQP